MKRCCTLQVIIIKQIFSDICHWYSLEFDIELQIALFSFVLCRPWHVETVVSEEGRNIKKKKNKKKKIKKKYGYSANFFRVAKQWRLTDNIAFSDFWHIFCIKNYHHIIRAGRLCLPFVAPLLRNRKISKRISLLNCRLRIKLIGRRAIYRSQIKD